MTISFLYFWTLVLGLCLGSFINVLVVRNKQRQSIVTGRSQCPQCKHVLAWFDLIPLLSYLSLQGKCRYCKKTISWQYPLMEAAAALLTLFAVHYGLVERGSVFLTVALIVAVLIFLTVSVIDMQTLEVPVEYCVAAGVIGGFAMSLTHMHSWLSTIEGALVGAGSIALILYGWRWFFHQDGMGEGDIWIAGAVGAITGYPFIIVALMSAVLLGAVLGILALGVSKKSMQTVIPFGPFLFAGMLIALWCGRGFLLWYGWVL